MIASDTHLAAIADASLTPLWLDNPARPETLPTLVCNVSADLAIVGGGFTGLWSAVIAKQRNPRRHVVVLEAGQVAGAATGRNGGFLDASLTHGPTNARHRFPSEADVLDRLGTANLDAIERTVLENDIDCAFHRPGVMRVVTTLAPSTRLHSLRVDFDERSRRGEDVTWLDTDAVRGEVRSPTYAAGCWRRHGTALADPARLAWGLKSLATKLGVEIYEDTRVTGLHQTGASIVVETPLGKVTAERVALATNAFRPLVRRARPFVIPVYDYCLATEPLTPDQLISLGWASRQGIVDVGNQFHYYRLTPDNRITWGGYDAVYYRGGRTSTEHEKRMETWARLAQHFFTTFPQLEGLRFSHMWGGAIDTCSRLAVHWGTSHRGRTAYAQGYTGLGVAASRFGAEVMLDLLDDNQSPARSTQFVRQKPLPYPPEPLRTLGVRITQRALAREDVTGTRGVWLRTLDRIGYSFDT